MLLLEELVAAELEGALQEVAGEGGAKARQERAGALALDHLPEAADHALVVYLRLELDSGLDAVVRFRPPVSQCLWCLPAPRRQLSSQRPLDGSRLDGRGEEQRSGGTLTHRQASGRRG